MKTLKFDLLKNAEDSLGHAVQNLAWPDDAYFDKYKHAILNVFQCVELLLKERLRRVNPALVWENVDKYPSLNARTVGVDKAIARLDSIGGIRINEADKNAILGCKNLRNVIQHYEFEIAEKEAKTVIAKMLAFVFSFSKEDLDHDVESAFREDDTWELLLENLYEFADEYGPRISQGMLERGGPVDTCPICGQETLDLVFEQCILCGNHFFGEGED